MKHMTEEELIAFREGVVEQRAAIPIISQLVKNAEPNWSALKQFSRRWIPCRYPTPAPITAGASGSRLLQGCRRNREHGGRRGSSRAGSL